MDVCNCACVRVCARVRMMICVWCGVYVCHVRLWCKRVRLPEKSAVREPRWLSARVRAAAGEAPHSMVDISCSSLSRLTAAT